MTFNLRFENDLDGPNGWLCRRELVVRLIERYKPSILGTQEGKCSQLLYLRDHLPDYHFHAPDRFLDDTCQYPTICFRKKDFEALDGGEFWLSKTPDVHRSKNWGSAFPGMMSYAQLGLRETGNFFWVAVTHLDHMSSEARYQQAKILADWIRQKNGPIILMGDFNDVPGSQVHRFLTTPNTCLKDTWRITGREEGPNSHTHHGFNGTPQKGRLDWILAGPDFRVMDARIIRDNFNGRYPSDHFPYGAELKFGMDEGNIMSGKNAKTLPLSRENNL